MRSWLLGTALLLFAAGCGGGTTPNGQVAPSITSTPPSTATEGVPFNYTVTASGMTPMEFAVVSGPPGMSVHPATGVVTWMPMTGGSVPVELSVTNIAGVDTQAFTVEVEGLTGPVFTTEPPTEATVAAEYAYDPSVVANGTVTWSAPVAPEGLTIDPESGSVRWTPTEAQAGSQDITVRATEDESGLFTDQAYAVDVENTGGPAVITSAPPENVLAGELFTYDATAAGASTIQWSLQTPTSGTPAEGVTIVTNPPVGPAVTVQWDTAVVAPGEYTIALQAQNQLGAPSVQEFSVTVDPRPPVPEIDLLTNPPPATMFVGTAYTYDVALTPESESEGVVWSLTGTTVPEDLAITIDATTGEVGFTASESNGELQYSYTVRAENVLGEGDEATIVVDAVFPPAIPILTVVPDTVFTLEVGERFLGAAASATGNPTPVLSIDGTLPDFLEFDPLTGLLSASSTKPEPDVSDLGLHTFDIVATNTEGTDRETIEITVIAAPPSVDSITPAAGRRQSDVPIVVRGAGFVTEAAPTIRIELGAYQETLATTFVDDSTLTATVPIDLARPSGVYDVVVDQGSTTSLAKRFTVTEGAGTTLSGSVGVDITLQAIDSPHVITDDLRIENGATLTVEPGAVVMLAGATNRRIDVGTGTAGALVADGGEPGVGDQIVFTRFQDVGAPPPSGHYRGLRFGANIISSTTTLQNVVVEFGGRRNTDVNIGAIEVLSASAPTIADSIVRESLNYGLYAQGGAGSETLAWFDDNQLTANGRAPISVGSNEVSTLGANLEVLENGEDRIFVRGSTVNRADASWANYGVPYFLDSGIIVRGGSTMTLAAGTEMRFDTGSRLQVSTDSEEGTLVAASTPEAPIRLVANDTVWDGVHLGRQMQAGTVLRNVRVEGFSASVNGGVRVDNPLTAFDPIAIIESSVIESAETGAVGVYVSSNARVSSFQNNVVDVDGFTVSASLAGFDDVLQPSNVYEAPLRVRSSSVTGATMVWNKPVAGDGTPQPIQPTGNLSVEDGALTIAAGNRLEMPLNGQITITNAELVVNGTAGDQVVFTPASGVAHWYRIRMRGIGSGGASTITYAMLESAGNDPALGADDSRAAIVLQSISGVPALASVTNTTVVGSNGYGITFADGSHCNGACDDNVVVGSRFSAVRIHANSIGRFGTGNTLSGNNTSSTPGHEGVWTLGDVVDTTATWPANDVPYVVQGDIEIRQSDPTAAVPVVTLEPGTEMRFETNRRLRVGEGNDGMLDAQGTVSSPITFTTADTVTPTFWRGIDFNQGSDGSVLDHVTVSYGGRTENTGNVNFRSGAVVTIGIVTLSHSEDYGAVIYSGSAPMFTGPSTDRVYTRNGQESIPGPGDPTFDCVRDTVADTCLQL